MQLVGVGACKSMRVAAAAYKSKRVAAAAELRLDSFWGGRTVQKRIAIKRFDQEALIEK